MTARLICVIFVFSMLAGCAGVAASPPAESTATPSPTLPDPVVFKSFPRELSVVLDHGDILAEERAKKRARGLQYLEDELVAETNRKFQLLVEEVFPNGKMGNIVIAHYTGGLPILTVVVPNRAALKRLYGHPKVVRVYEAPSVELFEGKVTIEKTAQ
jgi:hypothetical protein